MPTDEHRLWFDERAAELRERDRQREPSRRAQLPSLRPGTALVPSRTVRLDCPQCSGPVYAVELSDRELVECTNPECRAELSTRLQIDGTVALVLVEVSP